jgi:intracellular multiplication protein IcmE
MSDEFDDEVSLDDTFDDFKEGGDKKTLGDAWRKNSLFKIGAVVGVGVLVFGAISLMGGEKAAPTARSYVGESSAVSVAPGTEEASPAYIQALEEQNEADRELAEATGGSALPVPIEPPVGVISVPQEEGDTEDPLQRWRRLQEERLQREIQQRETIGAVSVNDAAQQSEAILELAESMQEQMTSILETQSQTGVSTLNPTDPGFLEYLREQREGDDEDGENGSGSASGSGSDSDSFADEFEEDIIQETLVAAGQIAYAQLLTEANTDSPGPVLAQIMSGPLAGSRILGSFEEENDLLTLNFDTVVIDGESISIDAVGLDPDTTLPGMATDVNHRYLQRIVLPAAAAFIEGLSSAVAENGSTTITINGTTTTATDDAEASSDEEIATGVEEAGQELREIIDDMTADIETMVRIQAGTPIGILFVEPVQTGDAEI